MRYRRLGRTGLNVSEIGLGCAEMGMRYGTPGKRPAKQLSSPEARVLVESALKCGINFFDTAPGYGESERLLGSVLKELGARALVATKCGPFSPAQLAQPRVQLQ